MTSRNYSAIKVLTISNHFGNSKVLIYSSRLLFDGRHMAVYKMLYITNSNKKSQEYTKHPRTQRHTLAGRSFLHSCSAIICLRGCRGSFYLSEVAAPVSVFQIVVLIQRSDAAIILLLRKMHFLLSIEKPRFDF